MDNIKPQRKLLINVFLINFVLFLLEIVTGFLSDSLGLVADSLDMLADAFVYALGLYAVGKAMERKKSIAILSGYFQLVLAVLGIFEVMRRFFGFEDIPEFETMIVVSSIALLGNVVCMVLFQESKNNDVHFEASRIFTNNDLLANIGVIVAGALVHLTDSIYPDLIIGTLVFLLVARGAVRILQISK